MGKAIVSLNTDVKNLTDCQELIQNDLVGGVSVTVVANEHHLFARAVSNLGANVSDLIIRFDALHKEYDKAHIEDQLEEAEMDTGHFKLELEMAVKLMLDIMKAKSASTKSAHQALM